MIEITAAIMAKYAQIKTLQSDIEALQRAATVLGGETTARAASQPKTKSNPKQQGQGQGMSATARKAVSRRMKAYWAEQRAAKRKKG